MVSLSLIGLLILIGNVALSLTMRIDCMENKCYIRSDPYWSNEDFRFKLLSSIEPENITDIEVVIYDTETKLNIDHMGTDIFQLFRNLQTLDVSSKYQIICANDLQIAPELTHLHINGNNFDEKIKTDLFKSQMLKSLKLTSANINEIDDNVFNNQTELIFMSLAINNISKIRRYTLTGLSNLEILDLSNNQITVIEEDGLQLPSLKELDLSVNQLKTISDNLFNGMPIVEKILLASNHLERISNLMFSSVSLKILILTHNNIAEIDDNAFMGQSELLYLLLEANKLFEIKSNTFTGLTSLTLLHLERNQIHTIADGALQLPALHSLFLGQNSLKILSDNAFETTLVLETIYINRNKLERIGTSLYGLREAEIINVDENIICDIDLAEFAKLPKLKELSLDRSGFFFNLTAIPDVQSQSRLKKLNLSGNNLSNPMELNNLRMFPDLKELNLKGNPYNNLYIDQFNETIVDILPKLEDLYLRNTNISCFESDKLKRNRYLRVFC